MSPAKSKRGEFCGAKIREERLANGLRVLLVERHLDPVVAVTVWYKVGARDEAEHESGVSHFLEHMMFKGSRSYPKGAVDAVTTERGGQNNAFTTPDHTAYWFEFASDRWEVALAVEADRMRSLLLDPAEFASEKAVVLEELSMGLDDPWRRLTQAVQSALYPRHAYGRPVIGYRDVLEELSVEEMRDYYGRFYHPGNACLVVCGDFVPKQALATIEQYFGSLPIAEVTRKSPKRAEPTPAHHRIELRWDDPAQRLAMAWPSLAVTEEDEPVLDVISGLLSMGRLARLHQRAVLEEELAIFVSCNNDARVDGGIFWLITELAQGADPAELEALILEELDWLCEESVPRAELDRSKASLLAGEAFEGETVSDLGERLGEFATDSDWRDVITCSDRIRAVKAADVKRVARMIFRSPSRIIGWSVPQVTNGVGA